MHHHVVLEALLEAKQSIGHLLCNIKQHLCSQSSSSSKPLTPQLISSACYWQQISPTLFHRNKNIPISVINVSNVLWDQLSHLSVALLQTKTTQCITPRAGASLIEVQKLPSVGEQLPQPCILRTKAYSQQQLTSIIISAVCCYTFELQKKTLFQI